MTRSRHTTQSHGKRPASLGQLAAGQQLGRYQVLAELASGGMAVVHVASAQGAAGFERLVALKVLHAHLACEEEFIKMFLDEARLAAGIRHPNVVSTIDISDSLETGYFLVMEYVEGDHFGALLSAAHKRGERLPLPVVMRIVMDALGGLGAAHDLRDGTGKPLQLVHRDVSPHNVMVGTDGVSRLTDFGVAKAEDRLTQTRHGEVKGKLSYMAPEQASSGMSDRRSDLFSAGIMLWEAVTGRRLFRGETVSATLSKLLANKIAPPSAIDPALAPLDPLLRKALAHEPAARFQSAEEFIDALEQTARSLGGVASWRMVSDAVNEYANEKLTRERKLISAAKLVLNAPEAAVDAVEVPLKTPSAAGLSLEPGVSAPLAEPSGVFSNVTAPGRRVRNTRTSAEPAADTRAGRGPSTRAGTPSGELAAQLARSQTPPPVPRSAQRTRSSEAVLAQTRRRSRATALGLAAAALLFVGGWLLWSNQGVAPQADAAPVDLGAVSKVDEAEVPGVTTHLTAPAPVDSAGAAAAEAAAVETVVIEPEVSTPPVPARPAVVHARPSRHRPSNATRPKRPRKTAPASVSSARNETPRPAPTSPLLPLPNPYTR